MKNILSLLILSLMLINCSPRIVEHTVVVTKVPQKVAPPIEPNYLPIPNGIHLGSKQALTIILHNFMEAESARKSAKAAYDAYNSQVTSDEN